MTLSDIIQAAKEQYNAGGDSFWSESEYLRLIYHACLQLSTEGLVIERVFSTNTVIDQREYLYPTNTISIKRVEWNGKKLQPIDFTEDDSLTLVNSTTTSTGDPSHYAVWNETLYLRPIPSSVQALKIYSYNEPQEITSILATIEIPSLFHYDVVDYILCKMYAKDKDLTTSQYYLALWNEHLAKAKRWKSKRKRGDGFKVVKDEESLAANVLGYI